MCETKPLRVLFVPLPSPGHIIPMIDIAKIFAARGVHSTIVVTPLNADRFRSIIARSQSLNHQINLHVIPFPSTSLLPPNCESTDTLPDRSLSDQFSPALALLQAPFDQLVRSELPDAIVSDLLLPWTASVASELGIPRYAFPGTGCFALSVEVSLLLNRGQIGSSDRFVVPDLPNTVHLTRSKLAEATLPGKQTREFFEQAREADLSTVGVISNSFSDLEPHYAEHYERITGKRVWMVGPVSLCNRVPSDVIGRGRGAISPNAVQVLNWLDMRPAAGSVLYVCFGSLTHLPMAQMKEIGFGLEKSRVPFVWVIREEEEVSREKWVGELESRVEGWGLVIKGWAPQTAILCHTAVGGFMTHCGWGSITEAAAAGVPLLTWPMFAEQFYNEALVVNVAGVGVKVGAEVGFVWGEEEGRGVVVGRERISERVLQLMGKEAENVKEVWRKAREMGERARRAVEVGGSSYESLGMLMEDMQLRSQNVTPVIPAVSSTT